MSQWTPEAIASLIVAVTGLVTAAGALWHSKNTRKGIAQSEMDDAEKNAK